MSEYYNYGQWPPPQQQPPHQAPPLQPAQQGPYGQYDYPPVYGAHPYQATPQYPVPYGASQAGPPVPPHQMPPQPDFFTASQTAYRYNTNRMRSSEAVAVPLTQEPPPTPSKKEIPASGSFSELFQPHRAPEPYASAAVHADAPVSAARPPQTTLAAAPRNAEAGELEEGELSEDSDMYDPQTVADSAALADDTASDAAADNDEAIDQDSKQPSLEPPAAIYAGVPVEAASRDASVIDPQDDAFYDEEDEEDEERGGAAVNGNGNKTGLPGSNAADADDEYMGFSDSDQKSPPSEPPRAASYSPHLSPRIPAKDADKTEAAATAKKPPFASVDEAKKEAQRAILRLIPYGVSYQTYIDEGFDEKTMRSLFSELGLKFAQTAPSESPQASPKPTPVAESQPSDSNAAGPKPEERKDRIARLLALKASKPTPAPAPAPAAAVPTPPADKTDKTDKTDKADKADKTKSEKARLLQQKLDALKKAQAATHVQAVPKPTAEAPAAVAASQPPVLSPVLVHALPPRPETAPSPAATPQPAATSRKRPVAADFNDMSALPPNPLKRPFGQRRQDSSLIIDVSDDSDDDVEMGVDSPTEEHPVRAIPGGRRGGPSGPSGHAVRDFAALTESPVQPRSFGWTPPSGPAATRAKDNEYAIKLRQIEEMKRRIAEAEAKKARSSPSGSQTPQTGDNTPPEARGRAASTSVITAEAVSAKLPKQKQSEDAGASAREDRRELRTRIASQQLPRVEARLKEKMFKLKLLQDKVAALQTEIDVGMAEKTRLAETMDELEKEGEEVEEEVEEEGEEENKGVVDMAVGEDVKEAEENALDDAERSTAVPLPTEVHAAPEPIEVPEAEEAKPEEEEEKEAAEPTEIDEDGDVEMASEGGEAESEEVEEVEDDEAEEADEAEAVPGEAEAEAVERAEPVESVEPKPAESAQAAKPEAVAFEPAKDVPLRDELLFPSPLPPQADKRAVAAPRAAARPAMSTLVPYESPLKYFRSYRFHPQYKADVQGGLKSLTYSGRIDADVELCPYELEGRACAVQDCPFQHLASVVPQDDQILVELGRSDDFTGEQKARFVMGLRDVLKRFRDAKVCDFDTIAYEIIGFRRRFLGDDSKVVSHLEDVAV